MNRLNGELSDNPGGTSSDLVLELREFSSEHDGVSPPAGISEMLPKEIHHLKIVAGRGGSLLLSSVH